MNKKAALNLVWSIWRSGQNWSSETPKIIKYLFTLEVNDFGRVTNVSKHENIFCFISPSKHVTRLIVAVMAEALEGSLSLDKFKASVLESAAAVPNVDINIISCSCRGACLCEKGRNYCLCKTINSFCSSACHRPNFVFCMNNRRAQESDQPRLSKY